MLGAKPPPPGFFGPESGHPILDAAARQGPKGSATSRRRAPIALGCLGATRFMDNRGPHGLHRRAARDWHPRPFQKDAPNAIFFPERTPDSPEHSSSGRCVASKATGDRDCASFTTVSAPNSPNGPTCQPATCGAGQSASRRPRCRRRGGGHGATESHPFAKVRPPPPSSALRKLARRRFTWDITPTSVVSPPAQERRRAMPRGWFGDADTAPPTHLS